MMWLAAACAFGGFVTLAAHAPIALVFVFAFLSLLFIALSCGEQ